MQVKPVTQSLFIAWKGEFEQKEGSNMVLGSLGRTLLVRRHRFSMKSTDLGIVKLVFSIFR